VATFIKEFIVKLPPGENLDFEAGGYIQVDVPPTVEPYKDFDITAHPKYHDSPDKFQKDWDKFNMWDHKTNSKRNALRWWWSRDGTDEVASLSPFSHPKNRQKGHILLWW